MSREVRLSRQAARDLDAAAAFLVATSPRAAAQVKADIASGLRNLATLAERGRPAPGRPGQREIVVPFGRNGYIIRYRVHDTYVLVARIRHSRQAR